MTKEYTDFAHSLLGKGKLLLSVEVKTLDEAETLEKWMFITDKPECQKGLPSLQQISWGSAVSESEFAALEKLKDAAKILQQI